MTMPCARARRLLWPDAGPRTATEEMLGARTHVAGCPACQAFLEEMRAMAGAIRAGAAGAAAPLDVRTRLFTALAQARTGQQTRSARRTPLVALVAVAVIVVLAVATWTAASGRREPAADVAVALADEHVRALGGERLGSTDAAEVAAWLEQRLPFAVDVPVFADARLHGARVAVVGGRQGAVVQYRVGREVVSYFVLPDGAPGAAADSPLPPREPRFTHLAQRGYRAVVWHEPGLLHAFVGGLPPEHLERLAKLCVAQARRAVASVMPTRQASAAVPHARATTT